MVSLKIFKVMKMVDIYSVEESAKKVILESDNIDFKF